MREFWVSSGHHFTRATPGGGMAATPELFLAYLARPELTPPEEACAAERALHASLRDDPLRDVTDGEVAAIADADARENWRYFLRFRALLMQAPSIEAAYKTLARAPRIDLPPMFLDQMAHLIARHALDGCDDPFVLRAGELFYRAQKASMHDGALLLADLELVEQHAADAQALAHASPLMAMMQKDAVAELDVMDAANAWTYWSRSDANTMAMNIGGDSRAREGLAAAIARWIKHLHGVDVRVTPVERMEDRDWRWFVGLDAQATQIGNALWRGEAVEADALSRIVALLRLDWLDEARVEPKLRGKPVWLILAMTPDRVVRMKPHNLVAGLPLRDDDARAPHVGTSGTHR